MSLEEVKVAFYPRSIAIVGALDNSQQHFGYSYLRHLIEHGYPGRVYPIDHNRKQVLGLASYPSLREVPGNIDYVICCIRASNIPSLLRECSTKGIKVVQIFSAGLAETGGKEAIELEEEILREARNFGIRLIGPNCLGVYNPKQGMAFDYNSPKQSGVVGALFQSGGNADQFIRHASLRGIYFSKFVSYGNALDLNEADFLEYLGQDLETKIIAAYIEGLRDARRFLDTLRRVASIKPVIVLKGGRTKAGTKMAASHTASLAGSINIWQAALNQAEAIEVETLTEMIDVTAALYFLPPITGSRVGIVIGGGGGSVLGADECEEAGLSVVPLPPDITQQAKNIAPTIGDLVGNPLDGSITWAAPLLSEEIFKLMMQSPDFDFVIAGPPDDSPLEPSQWEALVTRQITRFIEVSKATLKPLAVVLSSGDLHSVNQGDWRWKIIAQQQERLVRAKLPVYPTMSRAAQAITKVTAYYQRVEKSPKQKLGMGVRHVSKDSKGM